MALTKAPEFSVAGQFARLVPHLDLGASPNWLFTSGKPNRYNPAGIDCIYFGETAEVAEAEYNTRWKNIPGADQPVTRFYAELKLKHVLDLTDDDTLKILTLTEKELFANWRRAKRPTATQLLGLAVEETRWFSAIRYPSAPASSRAIKGRNIVIFRKCLDKRESVRILGPKDNILQSWP